MSVSEWIFFLFKHGNSSRQVKHIISLSLSVSFSLISDLAVFQVYWRTYKHAHPSITCSAPDSFPWYFIISAVLHDVIQAALCETVSVSGISSDSCSASLSGRQKYEREWRGHACVYVSICVHCFWFVLIFVLWVHEMYGVYSNEWACEHCASLLVPPYIRSYSV